MTQTSLDLFIKCAKDACNWSGTPLFNGTKQERGNLTQLKTSGLITTFTDRGDTFIEFTKNGKALAAEHGIQLH